MAEIFNMSKKELERHRVLNLILEKKITQVKGSEILGISDRQIRNLIHNLRIEGPTGIISKKRGRKSNRFDETKKKEILSLVHFWFKLLAKIINIAKK